MRFILVFAFCILFFSSYSQDHNQFWTKAALQYTIQSRWSTTLELHHRTQSDAETFSPFRYSLANATRVWISYSIDSKQNLNFSPYAFFSNDPTVNLEADQWKKNAKEHRMFGNYESSYPIRKSIDWRSRIGAEWRVWEEFTPLLRARVREGIQLNLNKKLGIYVYDELFINTINVGGKHFFDQNRLGFQAQYIVDKKWRIELGAMMVNSLARNSETILLNYVGSIGLLYRMN